MQLPKSSKAERLIAEKICQAVTKSLSDACSSKWQVEPSDQAVGTQPDAAACMWIRFRWEGTCAGEAMLAIPVMILPKLSLRNVPEGGPDIQASQKATLLGALERNLASLATLLDETGSISVRIEELASATVTDERVIELLIRSVPSNAQMVMSLHLCLGQSLIMALQGSDVEPVVFPDAVGTETANLDLVMGVELNVTLRFGQRQLALREVMELTSGSVVELDRQVDEPVELILDGRVIARGEAVIVDGNYGMRVTALVSDPFM